MEQKKSPPETGIVQSIRDRGGLPLPFTLALGISALVLTAVLSVLGLGLWSGAKNTFDLWRDQATFVLSTTIDKVRNHLEPSQNQIEFVSRLMSEGRIGPADKQHLARVFTGGLAAAAQLDSLLFVDTAYQSVGVVRTPTGAEVFTSDFIKDEAVRSAMTAAFKRDTAMWGEPLWLEQYQKTLLTLRKAVRRNGQPIGMLIASVTVRELSSYLGHLSPEVGSNVFILYDRERVLAHPNLVGRGAKRSGKNPLPGLAETGDPILASIWRREGHYPLDFIEGTDLQGHVLQIFGDEYFFLYRDITGFGDKTWQIGTYYRSGDVDAELQRLIWAALAGLGTLALAVLTAIWFGRRIARPVVDIAAAASRISQLDIANTPELKGSIFRELNDQAQAFNTMLRGLKWFEAYVPKRLVHRLMSHDADKLPSSIERDVTVMFTDIAGYSTLSEGVPATDIATLLNRHFELIAGCIEDEDGTVDKFIGDSVMAFWGAPDEQPDHAERAVRAARAIAGALEKENKHRRTRGEAPICIRIGLHSGPAIIGNIGAPERINYTIIGDTVNVTQRIEQLGKQFDEGGQPTAAVATVVSVETVTRLGDGFELESLGPHPVRGRQGKIEVFRLI
ncbi:MAG: adenylate/guanylate cyclase domain-containing protein [Hyphomicrobiaceae bacterium]